MLEPFLQCQRHTAQFLLQNADQAASAKDLDLVREIVATMAADSTLTMPEVANSDSVYNSVKALRIWATSEDDGANALEAALLEQIVAQLDRFLVEKEE